MSRRRLLLFLTLAVVLTACGSAANTSRNCSGNRSGWTCSGGAERFSGQYSTNVASEEFRRVTEAQFDVTVSVETGRVRVSFNTVEQEEVSGEATPNNPVTLSGVVDPVRDTLTVYFEALDGEATGLAYTSTLAER